MIAVRGNATSTSINIDQNLEQVISTDADRVDITVECSLGRTVTSKYGYVKRCNYKARYR